MRKIIDGLAYDTDKAAAVVKFEWRDAREAGKGAAHETLYRTPSGRYFLHGAGNSFSRWGRARGGEDIEALDLGKAMKWVERWAPGKFEEVFGPAPDA